MEPPGELYLDLVNSLLLSTPLPVLGTVIALGLVFILLLCSALISGSETAFFKISDKNREDLRVDTNAYSKRILKLLEDDKGNTKEKKQYLLATILVANNFINVSIIILSTFALDNIFSSFDSIATWLVWVINTIVVTFLLVLFGEVAPKVYANANKLKLARLMSRPLIFLRSFFRPINTLLVKSTRQIEKRLAKKNPDGLNVSQAVIDQAIVLTVQDAEDAQQEIDLLKSIVKFGNVPVKQVMCSRVDVTAIDETTDFRELLDFVEEAGHSRIPVYQESFDTVTGVLYVKDLLAHLDKGPKFNWKKVIRPPLFVPESKKIDALLKEFQAKHVHIAIVVDEYGGTSGIATLEDLLEEVIGEIQDEFDDETEIEFKKINARNFVFEGKTMLNDVCRIIDVDTNTFDEVRGDSDSLAGLMLQLVGRIPEMNEDLDFPPYKFKVIDVGSRRIKKVQITLPD